MTDDPNQPQPPRDPGRPETAGDEPPRDPGKPETKGVQPRDPGRTETYDERERSGDADD